MEMSDNRLSDVIEFEQILSPWFKVIRQEQDFHKYLLTLNTTIILITLAFSEQFIKAEPKSFYLIVPSVFFLISIILSTHMLRILGDFAAQGISFEMDLINMLLEGRLDQVKIDNCRKRFDSIAKKANKFQLVGLYFFFGGMISLIMVSIVGLLGGR
jgi:hypothetical protein